MSAITAELEMELEDELGQGAASEYEYELETPGPLPAHEGEAEAELEQESFFNHLAAMADRGGRSQALRQIGLAAAREALRSYQKVPPSVEGESEYEDEAFFELAAGANPLQALHANSMMEHLSHEASTAESEDEAAEQFLPLIGLAAKAALPLAAKLGAKVLPTLARKVAPHLTRGVSQVARTLFRSRATRPLLRTMPGIARKAMSSLVHQAARGHHITPRKALRTLARHTARTLGSPRHAVNAFRRSRLLDRRYHVAARRYVGQPATHPLHRRHWSWRYRAPGQAGYYRPAYYGPGYYRAGTAPVRVYPGRPGYYRAGVPAAARPGYAGVRAPRSVVRAGSPLPAPVAPVAPVAGAPCQCFRPVSCASCGGATCPACNR